MRYRFFGLSVRPGWLAVPGIALCPVIAMTVSAGTSQSAAPETQAGLAAAEVAYRYVDAPKAADTSERMWGCQPPANMPFERSAEFTGLAFTGRHAEYEDADSWFMSWAADGDLYTTWTDGFVAGMSAYSGAENASSGCAVLTGDDPLSLHVTRPGVIKASPVPYEGRYPCTSLVHDGVWYIGTYCLKTRRPANLTNYDVLGPLVGFRISTDSGKTWTETTHTPAQPLFGETPQDAGRIRVGAPRFVDFGRNLAHSPDGRAYLVAHGADEHDCCPRPDNLGWGTGDHICLLRVPAKPESINDPAQCQFFAGRDARGEPAWTSDIRQIKPLLEYNNHCGCVSVTYVAPLKKFLMCMTDAERFDTWILESSQVTGPWRLVSYLPKFGMQAYFVSFPSKFISTDGRTLWMCYSANLVNRPVRFRFREAGLPCREDPPGSRYGLCLRQVRLLTPADTPRYEPFKEPENVARRARVSVSSFYLGSSAEAAVDGIIVDPTAPEERLKCQWVSRRERDGAVLRLAWEDAPIVARVRLFNRTETTEQITSGKLVLSDGTIVPFGELPDDGRRGLEVRWPPRRLEWLAVTVTGVKQGTESAGLSEVAVYTATPSQ